MDSRPPTSPQTPTLSRRWSLRKRVAVIVAVFVLGYLALAYLVMPVAWMRYAHRHPALDDIPGITHTGDKIPGDALNVALIGTETHVKKVMLAAKWYPADPITLRSCLEIAEAAVLKRPYDDAPVSNLYLFGRKEDLAFEQPVGDNPRQRHHVRYWRSEKTDPDGRPVWVGAATYDMRVGLSHTTGQITHHTAPDIDAERDKLFSDLKQTGDRRRGSLARALSELYIVAGFHKVREGRNGGGDPWHTDGDLYVGVVDYRQ